MDSNIHIVCTEPGQLWSNLAPDVVSLISNTKNKCWKSDRNIFDSFYVKSVTDIRTDRQIDIDENIVAGILIWVILVWIKVAGV